MRGLVNDGLRSRAWPALLRISAIDYPTEAQYLSWASGGHADASTVDCDVQRCLWCVACPLEREHRRAALRRLLTALVVRYGGKKGDSGADDGPSCSGRDSGPPPRSGAARAAQPEWEAHAPSAITDVSGQRPSSCAASGPVRYYQGLHDVASVLLLAVGERAAFPLLCRLATGHLRDCTRPSLHSIIQIMPLMEPILAVLDPELLRHLRAVGISPLVALSWFLTWFAHDLGAGHPGVARLFDLFMASHPLMPLYAGAAALVSQRGALLACEDMPELHSAVKNLPVLAALGADGLAAAALAAYRAAPPEALLKASRLGRAGGAAAECVAPFAVMQTGVWRVPAVPPPGGRRGSGGGGIASVAALLAFTERLPQLQALLAAARKAGALPLKVEDPKRRAALVTTAMSVGGLVGVYLVNVLMSVHGQTWS